MNNTVKVKKQEYFSLKKQAKAYKDLTGQLFAHVIKENSVEKIVHDFKTTGIYSKAFLKDLEHGLKSSPYFKYKI